MKRKTFLVVTCLLIILAPLGEIRGSTARSAGPQTGRILGVVLDRNDARVAGATVIIEGGPKLDFKRELKSGEAGEFEIKLPPGVYRITVEANGFHRFEGPELKVQARATEMINIHLKEGRYVQ